MKENRISISKARMTLAAILLVAIVCAVALSAIIFADMIMQSGNLDEGGAEQFGSALSVAILMILMIPIGVIGAFLSAVQLAVTVKPAIKAEGKGVIFIRICAVTAAASLVAIVVLFVLTQVLI